MSQTNRIDESFYVRGVKCAAWLYLPANHSQGPVPAVVIGHGLGGVREWRLDNFAQAFRAAGYACLVFDYRGFGESDGAPRQVVEPEMLLEDWRAAIVYARARPEIDPDRIVLFGTSFSGGHVTRLGAEDQISDGRNHQAQQSDWIRHTQRCGASNPIWWTSVAHLAATHWYGPMRPTLLQ